jgi:hypothetical protein
MPRVYADNRASDNGAGASDSWAGSIATGRSTCAFTQSEVYPCARAILAPVNWLIDNAVLVSFLVALVAVLLSLAVLGIRIGGAYRRVRVATKTLSVAGGALADDVHRVVAALAALPDRQAEVQQAITELSQRAAAVGVLARHAMAAHRILRSPLWFVGR